MLLAFTLGLAAICGFGGVAKADPITYTTSGTVATPPGGMANMIYFNGISSPTTLVSANGIDLGQFQISAASATTTETFSNTPFQITVASGANQIAVINGTLFGSVGPDSSAAPTYTITSIVADNSTGTNGNPLFTVLPPSGPMTLNTTLSGGQGPASTGLTFGVNVPEPSSVLIFAVAIGGLGVYARRRRAA
jgi:hypothetical protein